MCSVAWGPPNKKKIRYGEFIKKRERRKIRGGNGLCKEEVVGRVVDGGIKYKETKEEKREREKRGKNKERIYRRGGRALTIHPL